jgi:uncharacterized protein (TIGR02058 family)
MMDRFLVEIGTGLDMHGGDVTKAAKRAVVDAMHHCCLCGITEALKITDMSKVQVRIKIGVPRPEEVDREQILALLPMGNGVIDEIVDGGLATRGLHVESMGEGDTIVIANASLSVYVDQ